VDIRAHEEGLVRHLQTGLDGRFAAGGLPSGIYDISVAVPRGGYRETVLTGLPLPQNGFAEIRVLLGIGQRDDKITLNALEEAVTRMSPLDNRWTLLQRDCDGGQTQSCRDLGDIHVTAGRRRLAATAYMQACDQKDGLGRLALASVGVSPDEYERRALPLLEHGCTDGQLDACVALAGVVKDEARTAALRAKACDLGNGEACFAVAVKSRDDDEAKRPAAMARALELLNKGCGRGRGRDCLWAAMLLMLPEEGATLNPRATEALRKACELGQKDGCDALRERTQ
jgi:TPR repeat protein